MLQARGECYTFFMKNAALVPGAIVLAGALIALAVYVVRSEEMPIEPVADATFMRPIAPTDHILGNPEALVTVVTYSDIDCAYCKQFQQTMEQLMTEYAEGDEVAWVYRHFPLIHIHENSGTHAHAAECVASIAGERSFWSFIRALHSEAPGSMEFRPSEYATVLPRFDVSQDAFEACMDGNGFDARIAADAGNALEMGATGTPFIVILVKDGEPILVSGALPYQSMKLVIEEALLRATQAPSP